MGYDLETMVECGVDWAVDQDPFKHVNNGQYPKYFNQCNSRVFQSFEKQYVNHF